MSPDLSIEFVNEVLQYLREIAGPAGELHGRFGTIVGQAAHSLSHSEEKTGQAMRVLSHTGVIAGPYLVAMTSGARTEQWSLVRPGARIALRDGYFTAVDAD